MTDEEKLELYQKFEYDLIIDTTEKQKVEIDRLKEEKAVWVKEEEVRQKRFSEKLKAEIIKELNDPNQKIYNLTLEEQLKHNEKRETRIKKETL